MRSAELKNGTAPKEFGAVQRQANAVTVAPWSPRRRLLLPLIVIALGGVAIHAIADFPFQIYSIQLYVATYLGLCWGSATWGEPQQRPR